MPNTIIAGALYGDSSLADDGQVVAHDRTPSRISLSLNGHKFRNRGVDEKEGRNGPDASDIRGREGEEARRQAARDVRAKLEASR